jgi:hypothetical protein
MESAHIVTESAFSVAFAYPVCYNSTKGGIPDEETSFMHHGGVPGAGDVVGLRRHCRLF